MNICGEGGEYETLTLDCPLFRKKIVLEDTETEVIDDVSFLKIKSAKLIDKNLPEYQSQMDMLRRSVVRIYFRYVLLSFDRRENGNCISSLCFAVKYQVMPLPPWLPSVAAKM